MLWPHWNLCENSSICTRKHSNFNISLRLAWTGNMHSNRSRPEEQCKELLPMIGPQTIELCAVGKISKYRKKHRSASTRPSRSVKQHLLNYGLCFDKAGNVEHSIMSLLALGRLLGRLDRCQRIDSHVEMVNLCESGISLKHLIYLWDASLPL